MSRNLLIVVLLILGLMLPALALAQTPPPSSDILLKLPRDLSPWGMFMAADIVVKAVMIGLVFASVLTWTIWFAKTIELMTARRRLHAAIDALHQASSWGEATARLQARNDGAATLIRAADTELRLSADAMSAASKRSSREAMRSFT